MRVLVITDLHACWEQPMSRVLSSGRPNRFQSLLDVLKQCEQLIDQRGITDLLVLGDVLHRRHFIRFQLLNPLLAAFRRLADRVQNTVILVGNHDYETDTVHGLDAFRPLPHTQVVDAPGWVLMSDGEYWGAIPYLHDAESVTRAFEQLPSDVPVLSHYATEGAPMETDWYLPSPLKLGEMARFRFVWFGHVHKPSELLGGKVIYVGAPMHTDFGDHGQRGALICTDGIVERVPLVAPEFFTATWPRIPSAPALVEGGGYLRILNVPQAKLVDAREEAVRVGWLDAVVSEAPLPDGAMSAAVTGELAVDRDRLARYVARQCSELTVEQREEIVDRGVFWLEQARR